MQRVARVGLKLTVWILGLLALGLVIDRLSVQPPMSMRTAEAQVPVESSCGDANGDERIDLSDAIYIINWALRAGPPLLCPDMQLIAERTAELEKLVAANEAMIAEQRDRLAQQEAEIVHLRAVAQESEARLATLAAQLAATETEAEKLIAQLAQTQERLEQCNRELLECENP